MEITEVRIKLMEDSDDRLQAFCSITFDNCFVVRDLKIIEGAGGPFVAMPSRKLAAHCPHCGSKNHLRAAFCNQCGGRLDIDRALRDHEGRMRLYADISHPINSSCREMIQQRVIAEYRAEREQAKKPGYISRYHEDYEDYDVDFDDEMAAYAARGSMGENGQKSPAAQSPLPVPSSEDDAREHRPQPAVREPRAPHISAARRSGPKRAGNSAGHSRAGSEEFGAGIF